MQCALEASNLIYLLLRRIPKEFDIKSEIKKKNREARYKSVVENGESSVTGKRSRICKCRDITL